MFTLKLLTLGHSIVTLSDRTLAYLIVRSKNGQHLRRLKDTDTGMNRILLVPALIDESNMFNLSATCSADGDPMRIHAYNGLEWAAPNISMYKVVLSPGKFSSEDIDKIISGEYKDGDNFILHDNGSISRIEAQPVYKPANDLNRIQKMQIVAEYMGYYRKDRTDGTYRKIDREKQGRWFMPNSKIGFWLEDLIYDHSYEALMPVVIKLMNQLRRHIDSPVQSNFLFPARQQCVYIQHSFLSIDSLFEAVVSGILSLSQYKTQEEDANVC